MSQEISKAQSEFLYQLIETFSQMTQAELEDLLAQWPVDLAHPEKYEVVGGLLARIATLALELAGSPRIWNEHSAPLFLRAMIDAYITLAWIMHDPIDRSEKYIAYGLGQAKLQLEHLKAETGKTERDVNEANILKPLEDWINSQQFTFLTEVNVGSWSGMDTRSMADEAGCKDFFTYAFVPCSNAVHSTWFHIGKHNLRLCVNPLHGVHRVPSMPDQRIDLDYFRLAAKYVEKAFRFFEQQLGFQCNQPSAYRYLLNGIEKFNTDFNDSGEE